MEIPKIFNTLDRSSRQQFVLFSTIAALCFVLTIVFAFRENANSTTVFALFTVLSLFLAGNRSIEYVKAVGIEVKMRLEEAQRISQETRSIGRAVARLAVRSAFQSTGWVDYSKERAEKINFLLDEAKTIYDLIGESLEEDEDIYHEFHGCICNEYVLHIYSLTSELEKQRISLTFPTYPNLDNVASPDAVQDSLDKANINNHHIECYLDSYRYYYKNKKHLDYEAFCRRADWQ